MADASGLKFHNGEPGWGFESPLQQKQDKDLRRTVVSPFFLGNAAVCNPYVSIATTFPRRSSHKDTWASQATIGKHEWAERAGCEGAFRSPAVCQGSLKRFTAPAP